MIACLWCCTTLCVGAWRLRFFERAATTRQIPQCAVLCAHRQPSIPLAVCSVPLLLSLVVLCVRGAWCVCVACPLQCAARSGSPTAQRLADCRTAQGGRRHRAQGTKDEKLCEASLWSAALLRPCPSWCSRSRAAPLVSAAASKLATCSTLIRTTAQGTHWTILPTETPNHIRCHHRLLSSHPPWRRHRCRSNPPSSSTSCSNRAGCGGALHWTRMK